MTMATDRIERLKKIAERTWTRTLSNRIGISYADLCLQILEAAHVG